MYNEGIHIDDVSGVVLLRPTVSPNIYFQQIGRALQAGNSTQPLIFDFVNNQASIRTNDLREGIKESTERENERRIAVGEREISVPDFFVVDETIDALEMFAALEDELVDSFDANFEALKAYLEEHGEYPKRNMDLGVWVNSIRNHKYKLNEDRMTKLTSIDFVWNELNESWDKNFQCLRKFKDEFGHCIVARNYTLDGQRLGQWVNRQRTIFKKGALSKGRINTLNSIGFIWHQPNNRWKTGFSHLNNFKTEFGHCNVPRRYDIGGFKLGEWVVTQRSNLKKGRLSQERIDLLNGIGFVWEIGIGKYERRRG